MQEQQLQLRIRHSSPHQAGCAGIMPRLNFGLCCQCMMAVCMGLGATVFSGYSYIVHLLV